MRSNSALPLVTAGSERLRIRWGHQNHGPSTRASGITGDSRTTIMSKINPSYTVRITIGYEDAAGYQWLRTDTSQPRRVDDIPPNATGPATTKRSR